VCCHTSCVVLEFVAGNASKVALVNLLAVGHEVKRWFAVSSDLVLHKMHSEMASQPFFCKLSYVCNLLSRRSQRKNFIFGGVAMC
jgi:hypothetical protein